MSEAADPVRMPSIPADAPDFESVGEEEVAPEVLGRRICDFDLRIEGRPLEKVIERFRSELGAREITRLVPVFYLTDEWGVPEGTVAIGMPFYLADAELLKIQRRRSGLVEGEDEEDVLRYLRHEMGHVVNYAYRLYATEEWTRLFGPMSRPYVEQYRALPFSPDYVRHLPGAYAQKHPDEDWAETFAVWMTPGLDWRALYADSGAALAKLEFCERTMGELRERDPEVTSTEIDYDTRAIRATVQEFYAGVDLGESRIPRSLDGDLLAIFARARGRAAGTIVPVPRHPAPTTASAASGAPAEAKPNPPPAPGESRLGDGALLLRRQEDFLVNTVWRWTGVDPALLHPLVVHLRSRATALSLRYPLAERDTLLVEVSGFMTTLAMNYVYTGKFIASP